MYVYNISLACTYTYRCIVIHFKNKGYNIYVIGSEKTHHLAKIRYSVFKNHMLYRTQNECVIKPSGMLS